MPHANVNVPFQTINMNDNDIEALKLKIAPNTLIGSSSDDAVGCGAIVILAFDKIESLNRVNTYDATYVVTLKDGETYDLFDFVIV